MLKKYAYYTHTSTLTEINHLQAIFTVYSNSKGTFFLLITYLTHSIWSLSNSPILKHLSDYSKKSHSPQHNSYTDHMLQPHTLTFSNLNIIIIILILIYTIHRSSISEDTHQNCKFSPLPVHTFNSTLILFIFDLSHQENHIYHF